MFERYLTDLVTRQFGHIIEGLDTDQVRLSTWKGELVLEHVTLRPDVLDRFFPRTKCPVEMEYGRVGHLQICLPWTVVRQQLWKINTTTTTTTTHPSSRRHPRHASADRPGSPSRNMLSVILTDVNILLTPKRQQAAEQDGDDEREDDVQEDEAVNEQPALVFDPVQKEQMVQDWLAAQLLQRATQYASSPTNGADTISSNNTTEATTASSPRWRWLQDSIADILSIL